MKQILLAPKGSLNITNLNSLDGQETFISNQIKSTKLSKLLELTIHL